MKRYANVLLLAVVVLTPLFATGCVYSPARHYRATGWAPGHWAGGVWIRGHWR
ncbi:MAG: hypothetical protein ABI304_12065 [Rudaea sp.]